MDWKILSEGGIRVHCGFSVCLLKTTIYKLTTVSPESQIVSWNSREYVNCILQVGSAPWFPHRQYLTLGLMSWVLGFLMQEKKMQLRRGKKSPCVLLMIAILVAFHESPGLFSKYNISRQSDLQVSNSYSILRILTFSFVSQLFSSPKCQNLESWDYSFKWWHDLSLWICPLSTQSRACQEQESLKSS